MFQFHCFPPLSKTKMEKFISFSNNILYTSSLYISLVIVAISSNQRIVFLPQNSWPYHHSFRTRGAFIKSKGIGIIYIRNHKSEKGTKNWVTHLRLARPGQRMKTSAPGQIRSGLSERNSAIFSQLRVKST